jgi:hypothetical protein
LVDRVIVLHDPVEVAEGAVALDAERRLNQVFEPIGIAIVRCLKDARDHRPNHLSAQLEELSGEHDRHLLAVTGSIVSSQFVMRQEADPVAVRYGRLLSGARTVGVASNRQRLRFVSGRVMSFCRMIYTASVLAP